MVLLAAVTLLCGLTLGSGAQHPSYAPHDIYSVLPQSESQLCTGKVLRRPEVSPEWARLRLALQSCRHGEEMILQTGEVLVYTERISPDVQVGAQVRLRCNFRRTQPFKNPGTTLYALRKKSEGIAASCHLADPSWLTVIAPPAPGLSKLGNSWIERAAQRLGDLSDLPQVTGLLRALILGEGYALESERWEQFRRVGVIHLLVVSGLHVGAVTLFLYLGLSWLLRRSSWLALRVPIWRMSALLAMGGCWLYVVMTGCRIPAMRAAILATIMLAAICIERRRDLPSALALAMIVVLLGQPLALWLPSFQLTFVAVIALMVWGSRLAGENRPAEHVGIGRHLRTLVAMTIAAMIGVMPLVAYHFHQTSLMGIVTNLFLVPLVSLILVPLGLVFLLFAPWWPSLAEIIGVPLSKAAELLLNVVGWADQWSAGWQIHFTPMLSEIVLWYVVWLLLFLFRGSGFGFRGSWFGFRGSGFGVRGLWLRCGLVGLVIICLGVSLTARVGAHMGKQPFRLTFVDVAQGLAIVAQFPNRAIYVIDGGGVSGSSFDMGRFVLAPFLYRSQIDHVDALIMTHHHPDHYQGLVYLGEHFGPAVLYSNGSAADESDVVWPDSMMRLKTAGIKQKVLSATTPAWEEGGVKLRVLHPVSGTGQDQLSENDRSLVIELTHQNNRFLITGDLEQEGELALVKSGELGAVDLVQVPHHGSDTSSTPEWLKIVKPKYAVISCGRHNRYGFPSPDVIAAYEKRGAKVYRTDLQGAITVESDGTKLEITSFVD